MAGWGLRFRDTEYLELSTQFQVHLYSSLALYTLHFQSLHALKISLQPLLISPRRLAAALGLDGAAEGGGELGEPGFLFELLGSICRVLILFLPLAVSLGCRRELRLAFLLL